ncbi:elongation factor 4 [Candidatus Kaiserbacteria bacterium RIFCSPLOWO2_02_FULL_45_11b]|uniref:Elongation factor 4 n=1 Tax=Candidatus Kaiserbacteria bacterium RIFCSPLOWO2_12_FULL_45_26 TaxID=1798525 RepID=A0A1F6FG64_9BACT|nr:MAG: elongation factor 4 [Candidatus Kaiserbacteria bacterium RIFCSPHIGHO2_12_45_16]OGG69919.1 MAG: elongation factor 4 [Candidatus Kaiserbacteria bacterium RIFCSPLOWO2_01_FULL_45_25]OGG84295.1 MAG: elongation factor 4 [Candidatus Kaiserbacteria bacterium RIFCSPLOWO2_02_FULL_45_11b]OGG84852.1 MAG: elongation factor 4 [Candidatus Kaiserbacteria bacterium RIFCSPLOWO2_12_FULL_45_26]
MDRQIRNFSIIAHIDHGKSTLADRMLEHTKTVEHRKMKEQILDSMDLERERGITIKMQPVRMSYLHQGKAFQLNLIDTPGHIDFSYEVSRALKAVEGVLLLVDSTQGIQAQTLTTLGMAKEQGLTIIPVLTKTDMGHSRPEEVGDSVMKLLGCSREDILLVSGKTGAGVPDLLEAICERIPPPRDTELDAYRGLIFDFQYSNHRGVIVYMRVFDGEVKKGDVLKFAASGKTFTALEVGMVTPAEVPVPSLRAGEIGYIVTGIKEPGVATVGDTLMLEKRMAEPLAGYQEARPVVWASVFPDSQDDFTILRQALDRLKLSDSSLSYEEESSGVLGRGFRCGFLGMLHLEIVTERLRREFDIEIIITSPSIAYEITYPDGKVESVYAATRFPEYGVSCTVREPWLLGQIISPPEYVGNIMNLLFDHEGGVLETEVLNDGRNLVTIEMPLRELMRNFFDKLKNATSGYASLSYEIAELRPANVVRLDVLVAEELITAFSRVVGDRRAEFDARATVDKLYDNLPRQQYVTKIQAKVRGKIIASRSLSALKKDVTGYLYGGDITRKMKLREKQKKGKKKALELGKGRVNIPQEVFMKMVKSD